MGIAGGTPVDLQTPSPEEATALGIREWPQQVKSKGTSWSESVEPDRTVLRYILDGTGTVEIHPSLVQEEETTTTRMTRTTRRTTSSPPRTPTAVRLVVKVQTGNLIQVQGPATLHWTAQEEIILLTPGFEEGGLFVSVLVAVLVLFGTLIGMGTSPPSSGSL